MIPTYALIHVKLCCDYLADLAGLSIASTLDLVSTPLGESNAEQPQGVAVSGLHIDMSFNQSLPLLHQRPQLVGGEIHTLQEQKHCLHQSQKKEIKVLPFGNIPRTGSRHSCPEHLQLWDGSSCKSGPHHLGDQQEKPRKLCVSNPQRQSVFKAKEQTLKYPHTNFKMRFEQQIKETILPWYPEF